MKKLINFYGIKKPLILATIFLSSILLCTCRKDYEPTQYNDWLMGKWQIENSDEYIYFSHRDIFIMNDTLNGSYEVQEKDDKTIWFYVISDSEEFEEDGEMVFSEIDYHKSMMVEGLPLHEEENIKINYIQ